MVDDALRQWHEGMAPTPSPVTTIAATVQRIDDRLVLILDALRTSQTASAAPPIGYVQDRRELQEALAKEREYCQSQMLKYEKVIMALKQELGKNLSDEDMERIAVRALEGE
jgi:hypothetical protein